MLEKSRGDSAIVSLADYLIGCFLRGGIIAEEETELYSFGLLTLLDKILQLAILLIAALVLGQWIPILAISVVFMTIKTWIGGWHASSYIGCLLTSSATIILGCYVSEWLSAFWGAQILLLAAASAVILLRAPIAHEFNPIADGEVAGVKKKIRLRIALYAVLQCMALLTNHHLIAACIAYALSVAALTLVIPNKKEKRSETQ